MGECVLTKLIHSMSDDTPAKLPRAAAATPSSGAVSRPLSSAVASTPWVVPRRPPSSRLRRRPSPLCRQSADRPPRHPKPLPAAIRASSACCWRRSRMSTTTQKDSDSSCRKRTPCRGSTSRARCSRSTRGRRWRSPSFAHIRPPVMRVCGQSLLRVWMKC